MSQYLYSYLNPCSHGKKKHLPEYLGKCLPPFFSLKSCIRNINCPWFAVFPHEMRSNHSSTLGDNFLPVCWDFYLTLHLAQGLFDLVTIPAVNHNIYLLFFPGDSSSVWSILILVFCLFWPDVTSAQRHLEVTAMADCVPFISVDDLREILTAVLHRKARTVQECRPLKVTNYLQVRNAGDKTQECSCKAFIVSD